MKFNREAIIEAAKELGRVILFAAVGWAISFVTDLPQSQTTFIVLAILRFVDKAIHENPSVKLKGLSPF